MLPLMLFDDADVSFIMPADVYVVLLLFYFVKAAKHCGADFEL
jgi:hypothetical protein